VGPGRLELALESELPAAVAVGGGTALFAVGWCFSPDAPLRSLSFLLDGQPQPVAAYGMPRLDVLAAHHPGVDPYATAEMASDPQSPHDPALHSYRSGFWGTIRIPARDPGRCRVALRAELEGGALAEAPLAEFDIRPLGELLGVPAGLHAQLDGAWPPAADGPPVAVCMATFNPPEDLFAAQVESIRAQTHGNWLCLVSDDCSTPERRDALLRIIGADPRFVVSTAPRRLGFYHNFERALALVPPSARYVVLADQDDRWHPDKLAALIDGLGDAQLVYSDARVIARDGAVLSDTWWSTRENNHRDPLSLLVANSVTGAASLLRAELLHQALPFPPAQFAHFHDHWLGLVAAAAGGVNYVDRPLYDYVQHGQASLGHAAANQMPSLRERFIHPRAVAERVRMWRLHYFVDVWRLNQFSAVLELRFGAGMDRRARRALRRFAAAEHSPAALAYLLARGARELVRRRPQTLGAEWMLAHALAWRRLLERTARERPQRRLRLDALPPDRLVQPPGRVGMHESASAIAAKIEPLRWAVDESAPRRVNLLIPTIDLRHFFGGYIGKMNLARRLAQAGERVRIVTVDPVGPLPRDWRATIGAYEGLAGLFDQVEVAFGRESPSLPVSRDDAFIATTWWTAHIAGEALHHVEAERFLYLIQEYEPFTFPMGTYAALAEDSYRLPHFALFSTELLRGYFRAHGIGVYRAGELEGDAESLAFENAITDVAPPAGAELSARRPRRLLFYARPEPHAARNCFELGVLALARAVAQGAFAGDWELHGIGTVQGARSIPLGGGAAIELVPRSDQRAYADLLRAHDVGLALMYTPHPSLVPIEMASAGMLTVTNSFENKTAEAMAAISPNLITVAPSVQAIADGLCEAAAAAGDVPRRLAGSAVRWSRDWDASFDAERLARLQAVLAPAPTLA
jgi:glycosyltransferase involved in cell wall biosynthesis